MRKAKYNEDGSYADHVIRVLKTRPNYSLGDTRLGFIRDPSSLQAKYAPHTRLIGALRQSGTRAVSLSAGVRIRDQTYTQACVGFAFGQSIRARLYRMGFNFEPSPLFIYSLARMMHTEPEEPLLDIGSMPSSAVEGLQTYGIVSEKDWPFDVSKLAVELPWDIQHKGSAFLIRGIYRVEEEGRSLTQSVCDALLNGYPVFFGTHMTRALENYTDGVLMPDDFGMGGHALCIVGYDEGGEVFEVAGSWGDSYGDQGFMWIHRSFLEHPLSGYFYVMGVEAK